MTDDVVVAAGDAGQDLGPAELLWGRYRRRPAVHCPALALPACTWRPAGPAHRPQPAPGEFLPERMVTDSVIQFSPLAVVIQEQVVTSVSPG